jgi:osmotically inducible protein OsmC
MKRTASAVWHGDLKQGHGALATHSGVLKDTPYSFGMRFEQAPGTNPEELLAAAHAGCFTMALTAALGQAGFTPKRLATQAVVSLELVAGKWAINHVHLNMEAWIPGIADPQFQDIAAAAKADCPVSKLFRAEISLTAKLEPGGSTG